MFQMQLKRALYHLKWCQSCTKSSFTLRSPKWDTLATSTANYSIRSAGCRTECANQGHWWQGKLLLQSLKLTITHLPSQMQWKKTSSPRRRHSKFWSGHSCKNSVCRPQLKTVHRRVWNCNKNDDFESYILDPKIGTMRRLESERSIGIAEYLINVWCKKHFFIGFSAWWCKKPYF